jgi:hypothetical protein
MLRGREQPAAPIPFLAVGLVLDELHPRERACIVDDLSRPARTTLCSVRISSKW